MVLKALPSPRHHTKLTACLSCDETIAPTPPIACYMHKTRRYLHRSTGWNENNVTTLRYFIRSPCTERNQRLMKIAENVLSLCNYVSSRAGRFQKPRFRNCLLIDILDVSFRFYRKLMTIKRKGNSLFLSNNTVVTRGERTPVGLEKLEYAIFHISTRH